jgi:hypothetical protein
MNDKCKYCDYVSKCSRICEYNSILCKIQRSFPKVVDKSYEQLQQENKQLKRIIKENTILIKDEYGDYQECNINPLRMKQKYEKQVDNWNKLKDYVSAEWYSYDNDSVECEVAKDILDKMQELEGSDSK